MARVRRAFSLRRNLRILLVPEAGRLRPLDGWRALSILWVVVFHAAWYVGMQLPVSTFAGLVFSPWMLPLWRGHFGVDVFFVLSGFLIAGMLIDERERHGRLRLGRFYGRRLLRLWPTLLVAVALDALVTRDRPRQLLPNLFYVSNFISILRSGAMGWTWSLAIEEQFYLVCPFLVRLLAPLRAVPRWAILGGLSLGLAAVAGVVMVRSHLRAFDFEIVINRDFRRWAVGYDRLYVKPWMRAGPLLAGVIAAYVYRAPGAMRWLGDRRGAGAALLAGSLALALACTHWPWAMGGGYALEVFYGASFRTLFGMAVAIAVLLSISAHPLGAWLGRRLSSRWLFPVGQLAYGAYLLNPLVTELVQRALAPSLRGFTGPHLLVYLPVELVATFAAATLVFLLVERPFMELRSRGDHVTAASIAP